VKFLDIDIGEDELPEGWVPEAALVLIKCIDMTDGKAKLSMRSSDNITSWEAYGMLIGFAQDIMKQFQEDLD
jgi:hypothetical protein